VEFPQRLPPRSGSQLLHPLSYLQLRHRAHGVILPRPQHLPATSVVDRKTVGNASRPLRRGAPTGATSSGAMAMARDPGHGGLAFLHSSVFHFLSFLLLYTTIYLTISRITFISQFSYSFVIFLSCCPRSPRSPWAFYSRLRPRYDILSHSPSAVLLVLQDPLSCAF